jgi:integrase/recombinase XerD
VALHHLVNRVNLVVMITAVCKGTCDLSDRNEAGARNPVLVYVASLESPRSRRTIATALKGLAGLLDEQADAVAVPWHGMSAAHVAALRSRLADRVQEGQLAPASGRLWIAALRGVLRHAQLLDLLDHQQLAKLNAVLKPIRGSRVRSGRALDRREIKRLFAVCGEQREPTRSRNLAVLAIALIGGLRRAEIVGLDFDDWLRTDRALVVAGKGQRQRRVLLGRQAGDYLDAWIRIRGAHAGPLIHPVRVSGTIEARRCSEQSVYDLLDRLSRRAGLDVVRPHDCRRTMVSALLDEGADLFTVMKQSGHRSAAVVAGYDLRPERAQRASVEALFCPMIDE